MNQQKLVFAILTLSVLPFYASNNAPHVDANANASAAASAPAAGSLDESESKTTRACPEADVKRGIRPAQICATELQEYEWQPTEAEFHRFSTEQLPAYDQKARKDLQAFLDEKSPLLSANDQIWMKAFDEQLATRKIPAVVLKVREGFVRPMSTKQQVAVAKLLLQAAPTKEEIARMPSAIGLLKKVLCNTSFAAIPTPWLNLLLPDLKDGQEFRHPYDIFCRHTEKPSYFRLLDEGWPSLDAWCHMIIRQLPLIHQLVLSRLYRPHSLDRLFPEDMMRKVGAYWFGIVGRLTQGSTHVVVKNLDKTGHLELASAVSKALENTLPAELMELSTEYAKMPRLGVSIGTLKDHVHPLATYMRSASTCLIQGRDALEEAFFGAHWLIDDLVGLGTLPNAPILEKLGLSGHILTYLPARSFVSTPRLKELDLSNNFLREMDPQAFEGAGEIESLNFENCSLTSVPDSVYQLPKLKVLALDGNPLTPDEKQKYLTWVERKKKASAGQ